MTGNDDTEGPRTLKTVSTAMSVLDIVRDRGTVGVSELADQLDLSKSTAYIHLKTLETDGFLINDDGEYSLAFKFTVFGEHVRSQSPLYRHGTPEVDRLAEETNQYTHIVTEENGYGINLYQTRGATSVSGKYERDKVRRRDYLHYTASGKAILAALPPDRVDAILDRHGLPKRTENTITDPDALSAELDRIRDRGYAYNDEEEIAGYRAVGAPIQGPDGRVLGSLSVSGPTSFMQGDRYRDELPERVTQSANVIEVNINMDSRS